MKSLSFGMLFLVLLSLISCEQSVTDNDSEFVCILPFEIQPSFPDGEKLLQQFIKMNLKYPKKGCVSGTAFVSFVVNEDGSLSDIKIVKGLCEGDRNAIEVFKKMPKWIPGKLDNGVVPMRMIYPIKFKF